MSLDSDSTLATRKTGWCLAPLPSLSGALVSGGGIHLGLVLLDGASHSKAATPFLGPASLFSLRLPNVSEPSEGEATEPAIGRVLGTQPASPLTYWTALVPGQWLQLDDVVVTHREVPGRGVVTTSGVVTQVHARHEGASFESDVHLIAEGTLPGEVVEAAEVSVTRVEPEIYVPPTPGSRLYGGRTTTSATRRSTSTPWTVGCRSGSAATGARSSPTSTSSTGRRAPMSRSPASRAWPPRPATPCSCCTRSSPPGARRQGGQHEGAGLLRQGRRPALPRLPEHCPAHRAGAAATPSSVYRPQPFRRSTVFAPPRPSDPAGTPNISGRVGGAASSMFWTLQEFCRDELLPFCFADAEDDRAQYTLLIGQVAAKLKRETSTPVGDSGAISIAGQTVSRLGRTRQPDRRAAHRRGHPSGLDPGGHGARVRQRVPPPAPLVGRARSARSSAATSTCGAAPPSPPAEAQVTVVDSTPCPIAPSALSSARRLRRQLAEKEASGSAEPLTFIVLDELNKYAPREGSHPIKEILLDVAERGRSLGVILIGAQQTASEVERRIVANCAIKVAGRLDAAEATRPEYGYLPPPTGSARCWPSPAPCSSPSRTSQCRLRSSSPSRPGRPESRRPAPRPPHHRARPPRRCAATPSPGSPPPRPGRRTASLLTVHYRTSRESTCASFTLPTGT